MKPDELESLARDIVWNLDPNSDEKRINQIAVALKTLRSKTRKEEAEIVVHESNSRNGDFKSIVQAILKKDEEESR